MNILEQEDLVKGLPDQALMQQAQMPTGEIPQFLVVSEIQRREKMRKSFAEAVPEQSIKDQVISSGIAAMNPNPDPLMGAAMGVQDPMMGQMQDPMQQMPMQDPMMQQQVMAAGGGMMPYRMQEGRDTPFTVGNPPGKSMYYPRNSKSVPGLSQQQLNAILANGVSEEEAKILSDLGVNFEDIALGQRGTFNPLNIRTSDAYTWEGSDDSRTATMPDGGKYQGFENIDYGIRAGDKILTNYGRKIFNPENSDLRNDGKTNFETYGESIDTLAETIGRFAPPSDNNPTESYVNFLSERLGIAPNEKIDLTDPAFRSVLLSQMAELETDSIYSPQDITERIARANALINSSNESLKTANTSNAIEEDTARAKEEDVVGGAELIAAPNTRGAREVEELLLTKNNINDKFEKNLGSILTGLPSYVLDPKEEQKFKTSIESVNQDFGSSSPGYKDITDFNALRTKGRTPSFVVDSSNLARFPSKPNNNLINEGLGQTMPEDLVKVLQSVPDLTDQDSSNNTQYTNEDFIRANLDSAVQLRQKPSQTLEDFYKKVIIGEIQPDGRRKGSLEDFKGDGYRSERQLDQEAQNSARLQASTLKAKQRREEIGSGLIGLLDNLDGAPADVKSGAPADVKSKEIINNNGVSKEKADLIRDSYAEGDKIRAAKEIRDNLGLDGSEKDLKSAGSDKRSFLGSDPVLGGLALAQLGAGIAQGDISAGLTGATKVISDERDRKSREEYYKALTTKASNSTKISYDKAYKLATESLENDPNFLLLDITQKTIQADRLAKIIMQEGLSLAEFEAGKLLIPGGSGSNRTDEDILNQYGIKSTDAT